MKKLVYLILFILCMSFASAAINWGFDDMVAFFPESDENRVMDGTETCATYDSLCNRGTASLNVTNIVGTPVINGTENWFEFDGSNENLETNGYPSRGNFEQSVAFWINPDTISSGSAPTGSTDVIWALYSVEYGCWFYTGNKIACTVYDSSTNAVTESSSVISTGQWTHVAFNINSTHHSIWINGAFERKEAYSGVYPNWGTTQPLTLGGRDNDANVYDGKLTGFYQFNRTLTATEISDLNSSGRTYDPYSAVGGNSSASLVAISTPVFLNNDALGSYNFTNSTLGSGNEQSNVTWYVNGNPVYTHTNITTANSSLAEGNFTVDDVLIMEVSPYDGTAYGTKVNSSSITVGLIKTNKTIEPASILHGTRENFSIQINTSLSNDITNFNSIQFEFNGTNNTVTYTGSYSTADFQLYANNVQMQNITNLTFSQPYAWYLNVTGEGNYKTYKFTDSATLSLFGVDNCSTYTVQWINFTLRDETNNDNLTGNVSAYFEYVSDVFTGVYNVSETNDYEFTYCLHPNWANETVDILLQYEVDNYESRDYITENYVLDNVSDNVNLFTILTTSTTDITVGVTDGADNSLKGILIQAEKYDISTNTYSLVESEYTDTNGEAIFQLTFNKDYYRFKLYQNGVLSLTTDRFKVFTTTYDYILSTTSTSLLEEYLTTKTALTGTLAFDDSTDTVTMTYSESTDTITNVCLEVMNINQSVYDTCDSTGSATLQYNITNRNESFAGRLYYQTDTGNEYTFKTLSVPAITKSDTWGKNLGLAVSTIIFLLLSLLGLGMGFQSKTSINAVMLLGIFSFILLKIFGFLPLGTIEVVSVICLAIILMVVMNKK